MRIETSPIAGALPSRIGVLDVLRIFWHFRLTASLIVAVAGELVREKGEDNDTLLPTRLGSQF